MKDCAQPLQHIEHGIPPVFDERSEVLVLGTMPSPKSREAAFFYGHPQNRFWRVLAALFDEPVPEDNAERADLLLRHHIALWDVLESCDIRGRLGRLHRQPPPQRSVARFGKGAGAPGVLHGCGGGALLREAMRGCQWLGRRGAALAEPGQRGLVSAAACGSLSSRSRCDDPL